MLEMSITINGEKVSLYCKESKADLVLQGMLKKVAGTMRVTPVDGSSNNKVDGTILSAWYKVISKTKAVTCCKFQTPIGKKVLLYNKPLTIKQSFNLAKKLKDTKETVLDMNLWAE